MEILYLGVWCRPFNQYWAVPPSSKQCSAATNHLITNAVLNISSDLMIISIPMPLLFKVKIPTKNKLILCGIFLIGVFNVSLQIEFLGRNAAANMDKDCCGRTQQILFLQSPLWYRMDRVVPPRIVHCHPLRKPPTHIPLRPTRLQTQELVPQFLQRCIHLRFPAAPYNPIRSTLPTEISHRFEKRNIASWGYFQNCKRKHQQLVCG